MIHLRFHKTPNSASSKPAATHFGCADIDQQCCRAEGARPASFERGKRAVDALYPQGVPEQIAVLNKTLCGHVDPQKIVVSDGYPVAALALGRYLQAPGERRRWTRTPLATTQCVFLGPEYSALRA